MHPCIHSSIHPFIWLPQPSLSMSPGLFLWSPGLFLWLAARAEQHAQSSTRRAARAEQHAQSSTRSRFFTHEPVVITKL
jgi:hypothetical protein